MNISRTERWWIKYIAKLIVFDKKSPLFIFYTIETDLCTIKLQIILKIWTTSYKAITAQMKQKHAYSLLQQYSKRLFDEMSDKKWNDKMHKHKLNDRWLQGKWTHFSTFITLFMHHTPRRKKKKHSSHSHIKIAVLYRLVPSRN